MHCKYRSGSSGSDACCGSHKNLRCVTCKKRRPLLAMLSDESVFLMQNTRHHQGAADPVKMLGPAFFQTWRSLEKLHDKLLDSSRPRHICIGYKTCVRFRMPPCCFLRCSREANSSFMPSYLYIIIILSGKTRVLLGSGRLCHEIGTLIPCRLSYTSCTAATHDDDVPNWRGLYCN